MQRHFGKRVAITPLILGSYAPDLATKWFVYGITVFGVKLKADNPAQFHPLGPIGRWIARAVRRTARRL
jgi:hypothetical protein